MLRNVYCGTYFTHVQTCNVTRVQSATEWTASVHNYFTHVQTCNVPRVQSATECILGFRVTLRGGLRAGTLTEGFQVPSGRGFRGGILRVASRYFQRGLKGGGTLRRGFKIPSGGLTGGYLKVTLRGGLKGGYLKVTLRGGLRGGTLRSPSGVALRSP